MKLYDELKWRGLIHDMTSPDLEEKLNEGGMTFYIGSDPTGDSLHIGHYSSLLCAARLKAHGHHPIMLVGGATGFIGDPRETGERSMLTKEMLAHNYEALRKQISDLFGFAMVNNYDWIKDITVIDFLRVYGKYFNVNYMMNKDTVRRRLQSGISYTEFSYMILQSLDYLYLYEEKGCTLQLGGQDQWGNITSGLELIRKKHGVDSQCYGLTMPLITKADGSKFGKSETGTIWLDNTKTSPYEMYQFLVNTEDEKVVDYLKKLTFLTKEAIDVLEEQVSTQPYKRDAQRALAQEVVVFLHGEQAYQTARRMSEALFKGTLTTLKQDEIVEILHAFEAMDVPDACTLVDVLVEANIASSRREAREWITQGSIQVNGKKIQDASFLVCKAHALYNQTTLLKKGKRNYYVIQQV